MVVAWDAILHKDSVAAAIYETWRTTVDPKALEFFRPTAEKRLLAEAGLLKALDKLKQTQGPTHQCGDGAARTRVPSRIRSSPRTTYQPSSAMVAPGP